MSFTDPLVLLGLPVAVALVLLVGRRAAASDHHLRRSAIVRAVAVAALVVALAGPRWEASGGHLDVVVLVDASDSMTGARPSVNQWLHDLATARTGRDRIAVAALGRDAQVEHGLREDPPGTALAVRVDGSQTDLSRGLRLAHGLAGSEQRRRVVLLTDGDATRGDTDAAVRELTEAGIALDVVSLAGERRADVLVEGVRSPGMVRAGESYDVTVLLRNTGAAHAAGELVVTADGDEIHREAVTLPSGRSEVSIPRTAADSGTVRYEARLFSAASTEQRNEVGVAAVQVEGTASVLLVEGASREADELAGMLEAGGIEVARHDVADGFPGLDRLLGHDAAVLVDVHHDDIGEVGAVALDAYVRDAGRGLTVVGGEQSYGVGDYDGTRLEELLPVFARVQDPQRRPTVAQALVVDVSGSMAACHCRPEGFAGGGVEVSGPNKTDISREAVRRAVDNLEAQDTVGVLAFHTQAEWVLPLQLLPDRAVVEEAVERLYPEGDTRISVAIREAIAGLRDTDARLRHIVLFTDGFTSEQGLADVAAEAAEAGVTLSVVGTGETPDDSENVLRQMAEAGNGRYYPGRDLAAIPSVLATEVTMVARPLIEEGRFAPIITASDPITDPLIEAPQLFGYVATTSKPTARTLLRIGDERDPLLTSWQAGLGTVAAWTSDATARWSAAWLGWEGARDLWSSVVRSTLPTDDGGPVSVSAAVTADSIDIEMVSEEALDADVRVVATIVDPNGERREVAVPRDDLHTFRTTVGADLDGLHAVTVSVTRDGIELARRTVTAIRSYPAEYAARTGGAEAAAALAPTGGILDPTPEEVFRRDGTVPGRTPIDLSVALLVLALLALPADVGLRRLRPETGDVRGWVGSVVRLPQRVAGAVGGRRRRAARTGGPAAEVLREMAAGLGRERRRTDGPAAPGPGTTPGRTPSGDGADAGRSAPPQPAAPGPDTTPRRTPSGDGADAARSAPPQPAAPGPGTTPRRTPSGDGADAARSAPPPTPPRTTSPAPPSASDLLAARRSRRGQRPPP